MNSLLVFLMLCGVPEVDRIYKENNVLTDCKCDTCEHIRWKKSWIDIHYVQDFKYMEIKGEIETLEAFNEFGGG